MDGFFLLQNLFAEQAFQTPQNTLSFILQVIQIVLAFHSLGNGFQSFFVQINFSQQLLDGGNGIFLEFFHQLIIARQLFNDKIGGASCRERV